MVRSELNKINEELKLENDNLAIARKTIADVEFQLSNDKIIFIDLFKLLNLCMRALMRLVIPNVRYDNGVFATLWQVWLTPLTLANDDSFFMWQGTNKTYRWGETRQTDVSFSYNDLYTQSCRTSALFDNKASLKAFESTF
jgi:hypothetical protein